MILFLAYFEAAESATVLIPVSIRQYQQEEFVDRYGAGAIRAVKLRCLKFIEYVPRLSVALSFFRSKMKRRISHDKTLNLE